MVSFYAESRYNRSLPIVYALYVLAACLQHVVQECFARMAAVHGQPLIKVIEEKTRGCFNVKEPRSNVFAYGGILRNRPSVYS